MVTTAMSPPADAGMDPDIKMEDAHDSKPALTPPTSEGTNKKEEDSDSELSDLEPELVEEPAAPTSEAAVDEEIRPDHYYEGGNVPVFKPVSFSVRQRIVTLNDRSDPDHESISKLQRLCSQNRQIWNEIWYCESHSTSGVVSPL